MPLLTQLLHFRSLEDAKVLVEKLKAVTLEDSHSDGLGSSEMTDFCKRFSFITTFFKCPNCHPNLLRDNSVAIILFRAN